MYLLRLSGQAGIQRDGTDLDSPRAIDGTMVRYVPRKGQWRPKKVWGRSRNSTDTSDGTSTMVDLAVFWSAGSGRTFIASLDRGNAANVPRVDHYTLSTDGTLTSAATNVWTIAQNTLGTLGLWTFDQHYVTAGTFSGSSVIIGHIGISRSNIDASGSSRPAYRPLIGTGTFIEGAGAPQVSGGIVVLSPYCFAFGSDGYIAWSDSGNFDAWASGDAGAARVAPDKIVKGLPLRAGSSGPAGLFWSLSRLIRAVYIGGSAIFRFDTLSSNITILSSRSPIEIDGRYYWIGRDRFFIYDGAVRELPNDQNKLWFFANVNQSALQKVFSVHIPMFNEIWWYFPMGAATEANHVLIYNYAGNFWSDTPYRPNAGGVTSTVFPAQYQYPLFMGSDERLWQGEFGVDEVMGTGTSAIPASVEFPFITTITSPPPPGSKVDNDRYTEFMSFEPDISQTGSMLLKFYGRKYARSTDGTTLSDASTAQYVIEATGTKTDIRYQDRLVRYRFESNVVGGDFEFGENLFAIEQGDVNPDSGV